MPHYVLNLIYFTEEVAEEFTDRSATQLFYSDVAMGDLKSTELKSFLAILFRQVTNPSPDSETVIVSDRFSLGGTALKFNRMLQPLYFKVVEVNNGEQISIGRGALSELLPYTPLPQPIILDSTPFELVINFKSTVFKTDNKSLIAMRKEQGLC